MVTKTHSFNESTPRPGLQIAPPVIDEWPVNCFKNASFRYAYDNSNSYIRRLLNLIKCRADTSRRLLVDVKVHDLERGDIPCFPGWHCDSVIDPFHDSRPERHFIYVTGKGCLTEFIGEPVQLCVPDKPSLRDFRNQLSIKNFSIINLESCRIHEYGRWDFHRGSIAKIKERRLLVRLTETELIRPVNKIREANDHKYSSNI